MLKSVASRNVIKWIVCKQGYCCTSAINFIGEKRYSTQAVDDQLLTKENCRAGVLLMHYGQPRTPYYAKEFLASDASKFYKVPRPVASLLVSLFWPLFQKVQFCIADYNKLELINNHIDRIAESLQEALAQIMPEFGTVFCASAFQYEEPALTRRIRNFVKEGVNRIVLLPLYPHYSCHQTGVMLNSAVKAANGDVASIDRVIAKLKGNTTDNTTSLCKISAVYRWNTHPALTNFWQQQIADKLDDHDSILFVASQMNGYAAKEYRREVWSSCERLMQSLGNSHTWRLAFYTGWNQWPKPNLDNITWQLLLLRREKKERTLVIPIGCVIPNFDSEIILPNLLVNKGVDLVTPPPFSSVLVHGFAEMVKGHLLGGGIDGQLYNKCGFCINPQCEYTKHILMKNPLRKKIETKEE